MKEVASIAEPLVDYFQIDDFQELKELRKHTTKPILVLGFVTKDEIHEAIYDLDATLGIFCFDEEKLELINKAGILLGKKIKIHLEIDALLGRLGMLADEAVEVIAKMGKYEHIEIEALYGHFSNIEDSPNLDHAHAQHDILKNISETVNIPYHISATAGILCDPETNWGGNMVRLGIGMYGLWPSDHVRSVWQDKLLLKPVLSWKTKVAQVKKLPPEYPIGYSKTFITPKQMVVAVIPQGYSDGYDRGFSNNGQVLIHGIKCPVLGRVAMNMFVVDVTDIPSVKEEDEVVLIGFQQSAAISAEDLGNIINKINYEIVARISALLPKIIT
jgi:alanine racemase